jgi:hypothetical protein
VLGSYGDFRGFLYEAMTKSMLKVKPPNRKG